MIDQKEVKNSKFILKKFFFPFSPIKAFRSIRLLFIMAVLLALRLVLGILTIRIAPLVLSISIAWVPVMIFGWYFGPIVGLFFGMITDTLSFLMTGGGIWFWMYATQEPIIGLLSGLVGSWCRFRKSNVTHHIGIDVAINQIFLLGFTATCYVVLIYWLNPSMPYPWFKPGFEQFYEIYRWIVVGGLSLLVLVYETLTILTLTKKRENKDHNSIINFIYTSLLVTIVMLLFSIALGPITTVEYFKFISGGIAPEAFLKYGTIFYLVPRIAIESIKVPLESLCLFGVVTLFDRKIINIVNKINNSWQPA